MSTLDDFKKLITENSPASESSEGKLGKMSSGSSGWRIQVIPFRDPFAKMDTNWGAVLGALLFVSGIVAGFKMQALFALAALGLIIGLFSVFFRGRITRRSWRKVRANCIDSEYRRVFGKPGPMGGARKVWTFRLLCEFEMDGTRYRVTPGYWSTFISEARIQDFLNRVVSPDGQCELWVNPKNPLQTELYAKDVKDVLLHS